MYVQTTAAAAIDAASNKFPTLPDGMERDGFIRLFQSVAKPMFGLTDAEVLSFTMMAQDPRPSTWKGGDADPCCWRQQTEVANRCQKSRHTMRRHEARLMAAGLIEKRSMAHGGRSGYVGCGIFFSPAITLVPAMLAFRVNLDEVAASHRLLCNMRSVHKGHCKSALAALSALRPDHPMVGDLTKRFESWPDARVLRHTSIEWLSSHVAEADGLTVEALAFLQETEEMNHRGRVSAAPYIQDTTQESPTVCNAKHYRQIPCREADDEEPSDLHKNEFHLKLGGATISDLCSSDMQMYLEARTGRRREPTAHDIDCAIQSILPELGINNSAWHDACQCMGRDVAAMCVIITDANRDHPQIRVRNPGGYLRGMTNAYRAGNLNIMGSLIALSERRAAQRLAKRPQALCSSVRKPG